MTTEILIGDCRETLRSLPEKSVHCCVTSPPYFGLRDYGTASWDGGDPDCDHKQCLGGNGEKSAKQVSSARTQKYNFRDVCKKCGAVRVDKQIGLEQTPDEYVQKMVEVFREVKRVLRDDGCAFVNLGDSYNGSGGAGGDYSVGGLKEGQPKYPGRKISTLKPKDLIGIPWKVAFALQADGWYLRQDIIWSKPSPMPESVRDRCTKSHEYVFLLSKSARYWMDMDAIRQKPTGRTDPIRSFNRGSIGNHTPNYQLDASVGANKRSVWTVSTQSYSGAHFATFPPKLIEPMILAGCPAKCCPVCGAGWVRVVERTTDGVPQYNEKTVGQAHHHSESHTLRAQSRQSQTIGFQPSCQCNAPDHVPGTVLDPFGGSGTTAYVANAYGRNAILCELNPEYEPLIRERLGMAYVVEEEERKPEQMELFT